MRHRMSLWVLLLMLTAGLAVAQYSGTYTIKPSGGTFRTHDEASDSLMAYGVVGPCTLLMYTGTYTGQAYFYSPSWDSVEVAFVAAPGESPKVEYSSYPWYIYYADNITVDGINTSTTSSTYGFYMYYSNHTQIKNLDLVAYYGNYAYQCDHCVYENLDISATYYGLYLYYSDTNRVTGCNVVSASSYGIYWPYSDARYIEGNNIRGSSYGIYAYYGPSSGYSYYDTLVNNMICGLSSYAIYHYRNYYTYAAYNTFYGGSYAYYDYYGYNSTYYNNIFRANSVYPLYKGTASITASNYNCFYGTGTYVAYYSGARTLAAWRSLGFDSSGMLADPLVGGPTNLHLKNGSPCIDAGMVISAYPYDIDGDARGTSPDIGADEWQGVGPPMAGTYLIHQDPDSGDFSSFGEALDAVVLRGCSGAVYVNVAAGTYEEQVSIGVGFTGGYWLTFQARGYGDSLGGTEDVTIRAYNQTVYLNGAQYIRFRGFNIVCTYSSGYAVYMYYTGSNYTTDCVIEGCNLISYYGVYGYYARRCSLVGNKSTGGPYGFYIYYSDAMVLVNNMLSGTSYGMYAYQCDSMRLYYNSLYGSSYGWYCYYNYYETMYCNVFQGGTPHRWSRTTTASTAAPTRYTTRATAG
jgi:parallel beta-helix repeat protein